MEARRECNNILKILGEKKKTTTKTTLSDNVILQK